MLLTQKPKNEIHNDCWQELNRRYLMAAIASVSESLEKYIARLQDHPVEQNPQSKIEKMPIPSALEQLCTTFELSDFERDILVLCTGVELKSSVANLCAEAQGDEELTYPTFALAIAALPKPHWNAITPDGALRHWKLIEVGSGSTLTSKSLQIDERVLHYLIGVESTDAQLRGMISPIAPSDELVPSHQKLAQQIAATWMQAKSDLKLPIIQLRGYDTASMQAIAKSASAILGLQVHVMSAMAIPTQISDLNNLLQLWEREAKLSNSVLLLDTEIDISNPERESAITHIIENIQSLLIVTSREGVRQRQRPLITLNVHLPTKQEQRTLWEKALGEMTSDLNGHVETLVNQFNLNAPTVDAVCTEVRGRLLEGEWEQTENPSPPLSPCPQPQRGPLAPSLPLLLWDACRVQARPSLDELAQRIEPTTSWDDLAMSELQMQTLKSIASHLRQRIHVYEKWGFASKSRRGLGISALFSGVSGTGKTTSAEVLAKELRLDLYRIDLSAVVSKYIGETEKNLGRIFDAADAGATILLFDEADSLFGKRSEVKDTQDRYANMEVSYLLQRMESYQGLAILTTNLKDSIDSAFLRRIRFVVKFTFPDASQREEIWRRIFPKNTPTEGLEFAKLARLNVAGGNIRNIALNAAFIAADAGEPVQMKHIKIAAQAEYIKLERTLTDAEVRGWV
ncbi:ATPase [Scytonema hofmannii PCC 7110]|uniref:ATPase n=1 Tax=Scytonema hofmannii PCC 7110 TaxID=128403 RepID=A0A139XC16_9CYAN|nr:ATP-binding protein [Scytonema hofmannii]KYC42237.1 ATPase [Scytonema hofmannii PCC 7110]